MNTNWRLAKVEGSFDRTVGVDVTVQRLLAMRAHFGVTRVTEISGLDRLGIPVHCAVRPRSVSSSTIASGKGLTSQESLASALAEAIESDCGERFAPADGFHGSALELRERYPLSVPVAGLVGGRPFPEELSLDWVWVSELLSGERVLFPLEFIRQGRHESSARLFDLRMSAGLASGNVYEEAVCHAIDELIERDAQAILIFRGKYCGEPLRGKYRRIRLDTLPARAAELVQKVLSAGLRISLLDMTTDIPVPTVVCSISEELDADQWVGSGTSLNAERAILRAITEAAQTSAVGIQGAREDLHDRNPRLFDKNVGLECRAIYDLFWDPYVQEVAFEKLSSRFHPFVDQDLDVQLAELRAAGLKQVIACEVSTPECDHFSVVRVVIPELELMRMDTIGQRRLRYILQ